MNLKHVADPSAPLGSSDRIIPSQVFAWANEFLKDICARQAKSDINEWRKFCADRLPRLPVFQLLHGGPIARRCQNGFSRHVADPETLDLIYGKGCAGEDITGVEAAIYNWESNLSFCESLRARRNLLASELDELCSSNPRARILALGSGHMREAECVLGARHHQSIEFFAYDEDPASLEFLKVRYGQSAVQRVQGSFRNLGDVVRDLGTFDFIYSLNWFDALCTPDAREMATLLASKLNRGGRLLIANFAPDMPEAAYIQSCLNWWPFYRTETEMAELTHGIPDRKISGRAVFRDDSQSTVFLDMQVC